MVQHTLMQIEKRDGSFASFDPSKIIRAISGAFREERGVDTIQQLPGSDLASIREIAKSVEEEIERINRDSLHVEEVQDLIEKELLKEGLYEILRRFIVFREDRSRERSLKGGGQRIHVARKDGSETLFRLDEVESKLEKILQDLKGAPKERIIDAFCKNLYTGIDESGVQDALILAASSLIEESPEMEYAAARLLLDKVYAEVLEGSKEGYQSLFEQRILQGVRAGLLDPRLLTFDLKVLSRALNPERDLLFKYHGLKVLYDRYFIHIKEKRIEAPQAFWMRVAMGLSLNEEQKEEQAIAFYNILSNLLFISGTPTLFNSGTVHPQLSSCYLSTVEDDLNHIFKVIADDAKLSKWAGGIGNDWTEVRARGALIKGTNGLTQGIIPFLKVANDTAVAVNQGGKRRGSFCAYIEPWHLDVEEFIELKKNTGDERRRTPDMNTALWVPDLLMKRVAEGKTFTLFNPCEVKDLHTLYGKAFEERYAHYEREAEEGRIRQFKTVIAEELWRKILTMLFETGHPWITFKDPSNIRSAQRHAGVIRSSNLCTEILLNTSKEETAVCNLGSINLSRHVNEKGFDFKLLESTVKTAIRMLDNVIDINYYPTEEARRSNLKHRPVGLGVMGWQEALFVLKVAYESDEAIELSDTLLEALSYQAIDASSDLAKERGSYSSFAGSMWSKGHMPIDTVEEVRLERGGYLDMDTAASLNWQKLREKVTRQGMRNCQVMAIAPTATIAQIAGTTQSFEPLYANLYVKSNLSGEFSSINNYLIDDLKKRGLFDSEMIADLKYFDGSVLPIDRIPEDVKQLYKTAFEIGPDWLLLAASKRQKWIDMGQSQNLYIANPSGRALSEMYFKAWRLGLKTTYYLRSKSATQIEKSTLDVNKKGLQPRWMKAKSATSGIEVNRSKQACGLDPSCESCQ